MVIWHLKQIGKVKKLDKWVPHKQTANQKNHRSEVSSLILCNNEPFLHQTVTCNKKWILYDSQQWPAQWLGQEETPKHFPKPNLHPKKVMVTVWWSAAHLIHYSFLNPGKTSTSEKYAQQIYEMHRKLQCLQLAGSGQQKGPSPSHLTTLHVTQPKLQKLNVLGYVASFASSIIFTWPLANLGLPLLQASQQLFAGKMLPQPAEGRKCFPRVHQISKHRLFTLQEKQTFLVGKNVLIVMIPILINKDVFEPS